MHKEEITTTNAGTSALSPCGGCQRPIREDRVSCLYCGWSRETRTVERGETVQVATYRGGETFWRFIAGSVVLAPLALVLFNSAISGDAARLWGALPPAILAFALGPLLVFVQFVRRFEWVHVDPKDGLSLPDGRTLPWISVDSVRVRPGVYRKGLSADRLRQGHTWFPRSSRLALFTVPVIMTTEYLVSAFALLTPWHDRVTVEFTNGDAIVLHDPAQTERLATDIRGKIHATRRIMDFVATNHHG